MKTAEAVKYMISVWDEVQGNWREKPDHVQQKFLDAEAEIKTPQQQLSIDKISATAFVESCGDMPEYVAGKKVAHRFRKYTIPVIEYNELRKAAKDFDNKKPNK